MPKVLIIHGAGMNMRGKVQTEIFGKMTLPEYDEALIKDMKMPVASTRPVTSVVQTVSQ